MKLLQFSKTEVAILQPGISKSPSCYGQLPTRCLVGSEPQDILGEKEENTSTRWSWMDGSCAVASVSAPLCAFWPIDLPFKGSSHQSKYMDDSKSFLGVTETEFLLLWMIRDLSHASNEVLFFFLDRHQQSNFKHYTGDLGNHRVGAILISTQVGYTAPNQVPCKDREKNQG